MVYPIAMYGCKNLKKTGELGTCGTGEDSENHLDCKEIKPLNPKGCQPNTYWKN